MLKFSYNILYQKTIVERLKIWRNKYENKKPKKLNISRIQHYNRM